MTEPDTADREQMHIRVARPLRREVQDYGRSLGITESAAAAVLLRKGLDTAKREQA